MGNMVNSPSAPVLFVYLNTGLTNVTGNGTQATILFDTVGFGDSANYSAVTGLYTVPLSGNFLICTGRNFNNIINNANNNLSPWLINSVSYRTSECSMTVLKDSTNSYGFVASSQFFVSATQTIGVTAAINNGTASSVGLPGGTSPYLNWMFIRYLF